ncbi:MAG: metallophosphoesterase [Nitrospiraceae bacterium]|nr:MAG: metallophosphoesterase [Nitrospiraceae bacterium]
MSIFLIFFFVVYGFVHLYAFLRTRAALSLNFKGGAYLAAFMVVMTFSPLIVYVSERHGFEFFARFMSYTGYLWMGGLFLFISASLVIDVYRLTFRSAGLVLGRDFSSIIPSARTSFFVPVIFSLTTAVYGYFEAKNILTEHVTIRTSKLPDHVSRLKIVQISDVHLGLIVREERLKKIIDQIKLAEPDILVSTGDLVDGLINRLEGLAEMLNELNPAYGKFAITGNHEFYAGLDQAQNFTQRAGFRILRGEGVTVEGTINIAGVDDPAGDIYGLSKNIPEKVLLSGLVNGRYTILLKHRPLTDRDSAGLFDLQLSGHTHKGQIFPFSLITRLYYPSHAGLSNLPGNSALYVSRGAGTWGPPIRFLAPPEVTVIELVKQY